MFCASPDPGLALFVISADSVAETDPVAGKRTVEIALLTLTATVLLLCLAAVVSWA